MNECCKNHPGKNYCSDCGSKIETPKDRGTELAEAMIQIAPLDEQFIQFGELRSSPPKPKAVLTSDNFLQENFQLFRSIFAATINQEIAATQFRERERFRCGINAIYNEESNPMTGPMHDRLTDLVNDCTAPAAAPKAEQAKGKSRGEIVAKDFGDAHTNVIHVPYLQTVQELIDSEILRAVRLVRIGMCSECHSVKESYFLDLINSDTPAPEPT